jgi:hypothetical protein
VVAEASWWTEPTNATQRDKQGDKPKIFVKNPARWHSDGALKEGLGAVQEGAGQTRQWCRQGGKVFQSAAELEPAIGARHAKARGPGACAVSLAGERHQRAESAGKTGQPVAGERERERERHGRGTLGD